MPVNSPELHGTGEGGVTLLAPLSLYRKSIPAEGGRLREGGGASVWVTPISNGYLIKCKQ